MFLVKKDLLKSLGVLRRRKKSNIWYRLTSRKHRHDEDLVRKKDE